MRPDSTVVASVENYIRMAAGNVAVATMFVTGRVKVEDEYAGPDQRPARGRHHLGGAGEVGQVQHAPAVRLSSYFGIPKPTDA